jgi:stage III sporulation protein AB
MWLKIIGSFLIIFAATCLGFHTALSFAKRPRHLRQIISCLAALKSQINYSSSHLSEALLKSTAGVGGPVERLFKNTGAILNEEGYLTPQEALRLAYKEEQEELALKRPERELLSVLFANLGIMDKSEQQKTISLAEYQLKLMQEEAQEFSARNVKMYRYLGVCGGVAVVIIFI